MTDDKAIVAEEISVLMTTTVRYDGGDSIASEGEIVTVDKELGAIWIRKGWAVEVKAGRKKKG